MMNTGSIVASPHADLPTAVMDKRTAHFVIRMELPLFQERTFGCAMCHRSIACSCQQDPETKIVNCICPRVVLATIQDPFTASVNVPDLGQQVTVLLRFCSPECKVAWFSSQILTPLMQIREFYGNQKSLLDSLKQECKKYRERYETEMVFNRALQAHIKELQKEQALLLRARSLESEKGKEQLKEKDDRIQQLEQENTILTLQAEVPPWSDEEELYFTIWKNTGISRWNQFTPLSELFGDKPNMMTVIRDELADLIPGLNLNVELDWDPTLAYTMDEQGHMWKSACESPPLTLLDAMMVLPTEENEKDKEPAPPFSPLLQSAEEHSFSSAHYCGDHVFTPLLACNEVLDMDDMCL